MNAQRGDISSGHHYHDHHDQATQENCPHRPEDAKY
jgi:hypothetical protein